jgi:hypothetical protein
MYTPLASGLHARLGDFQGSVYSVHDRGRPSPTKCPEPLCLVKVLPLPEWRPAPLQEALPSLHSSYGLMCQTKTLLPALPIDSSGRSLQVVVSPCWALALPDVISASPSPVAWTPIPVGVPGAFTRFLPRTYQPSRTYHRLASHDIPYSDFSTGLFSGLQSFLYVQAPGFARHSGRSYPTLAGCLGFDIPGLWISPLMDSLVACHATLKFNVEHQWLLHPSNT